MTDPATIEVGDTYWPAFGHIHFSIDELRLLVLVTQDTIHRFVRSVVEPALGQPDCRNIYRSDRPGFTVGRLEGVAFGAVFAAVKNHPLQGSLGFSHLFFKSLHDLFLPGIEPINNRRFRIRCGIVQNDIRDFRPQVRRQIVSLQAMRQLNGRKSRL